MNTNNANTKEGIDTRTIRACEGCMIVVPDGDATGVFDVYWANDDVNTIYTVDLREEVCTCGDFRHREPTGGCKHIRRVKLALGLLPIPTGVDLDEALVHDREKYGVEPQLESPTPSTAVATDGGVTSENTAENQPLGYTEHIEPPNQGGKKYVRCEGCGRELLNELGGRNSLPHAAGCPNATRSSYTRVFSWELNEERARVNRSVRGTLPLPSPSREWFTRPHLTSVSEAPCECGHTRSELPAGWQTPILTAAICIIIGLTNHDLGENPMLYTA